jgi:hypothetical protein
MKEKELNFSIEKLILASEGITPDPDQNSKPYFDKIERNLQNLENFK